MQAEAGPCCSDSFCTLAVVTKTPAPTPSFVSGDGRWILPVTEGLDQAREQRRLHHLLPT